MNETEPQVYQEKLARGVSPIAQKLFLSPEEQLEEFFFLGLRQRKGIDLALAGRRWGRTEVNRYEEKLSALSRGGWLERHGDHVTLQERALLVSNEVFQEFLAP